MVVTVACVATGPGWAISERDGERADAAAGTGQRPALCRVLPAQQTRDQRAANVLLLTRLAVSDPSRPRLRSDVVEAHLPLVRYLAGRYRSCGEPFEELVQVGAIGLIHAVDRFDADRGVELSTYAAPLVLGEIRRYLRDRVGAVRVPRRLVELAAEVGIAREELSQRLGRSPTVAEVAGHLGRDEEAVLDALEAQRARVPSTLEVGADTADAADACVIDLVVDRETLRPLLSRLSERDRRLLGLRLVDGLSQSEIAARMGISQMHVSRLLQRMVAELSTSIADVH